MIFTDSCSGTLYSLIKGFIKRNKTLLHEERQTDFFLNVRKYVGRNPMATVGLQKFATDYKEYMR